MRSYEELAYAFQQLELAALYWEAGKLDEFIAATGSALREDEDFLYANWYELLDAVADFTDIREDEDTLTCRMYFSDAVIRDYFRFARKHAEDAGIPPKQDPYYLDALSYFSTTMLDYCPYSCWFRLVTQTHHEYGYGLSVWTSGDTDSSRIRVWFIRMDCGRTVYRLGASARRPAGCDDVFPYQYGNLIGRRQVQQGHRITSAGADR